MGEVLSQNEIDSLLSALNSGEFDAEEMKDSGEKQVKNYDFARPAKFSKEHLRTMEIIFEHYVDESSCISSEKYPGGGDEFRGSYIFRIF